MFDYIVTLKCINILFMSADILLCTGTDLPHSPEHFCAHTTAQIYHMLLQPFI